MTTFYRIIRFIFKHYNPIYFRNFRVIGKENIPQDGAILFSPNHQNALLDPLLVGTTANQSIHSLTRSDVFGGPLQWFLDAMQTLPVYRIRDGYSQLKNNDEVFERCYEILGQKKHMMMFSEGRHHEEHYLLPLSKGSSRLVMEAQLRQAKHAIYLQPVGLNYGHHLYAQNDCVVVFGKPIDVRKYVDAYHAHAAKGLNTLRKDLQIAMEACLWLPKNDEHYTNKKPFINRKNTKLPFDILKKELEKEQPQLKRANKKTVFDQLMVGLFSLPNLPFHLTIRWLLSLFRDPVFYGSMNYLGSFLFCLCWWTLGVVGFTQAVGLFWGISFLALSISSLYLRQLFVNRSL